MIYRILWKYGKNRCKWQLSIKLLNFGPLSVPFPPHHLFKWLSKWAFKNRLQALPFVDIEISKYIKDFIEVLDPLWPKASHQKSFRTSQSDRITQSETNFLEKYIHFEIKFPKHGEKMLCNQLQWTGDISYES